MLRRLRGKGDRWRRKRLCLGETERCLRGGDPDRFLLGGERERDLDELVEMVETESESELEEETERERFGRGSEWPSPFRFRLAEPLRWKSSFLCLT